MNMSLFGSLMGDVEDDPIFGSHMRHMRQMNNMMNSLLSDPFGMFGGGGPLAIGGHQGGSSLMPFMPQMPSLNRLFSADLGNANMGTGSSYSSSTFVMSSGPNGKPQVYSSTSSTKIGPNGVKETRKTLEDSRTGTKKMSIGHHIGPRAHVIEREQNVYSGDAEERQEFINLDEEEAEDFDREFQQNVGVYVPPIRGRVRDVPHRSSPPQRLAIMPAPSPSTTATNSNERRAHTRPSARRSIHTSLNPLTLNNSANIRSVYGGSHPQRQRHKHRARRSSPSSEH